MSWLVGGPLAYQREREVLKRHDSTPPGSWLREQYEKHRRAYPVVEDAFDLPPATRESLFRRLDEISDYYAADGGAGLRRWLAAGAPG
jgi:hypothetical protein